jgi:hypothetical protein
MNVEEKLKDISEIKAMMEQSSKFLSLSGLAGVGAGIIALISASIVYYKYQSTYIFRYGLEDSDSLQDYKIPHVESFFSFTVTLALITLVLALASGFYFTYRKAKRKSYSLSGRITKLLLINLFIPLATGGIFALILMYHQIFFLVGPVTLIFYGMSLVNASKYTLRDVRYLGLIQIVLGLVSSVIVGYNLLFWALGFGVMHILYGIIMYYKYDR